MDRLPELRSLSDYKIVVAMTTPTRLAEIAERLSKATTGECVAMDADRLEYFSSHIQIDEHSGCWLWTGETNSGGYAQIRKMVRGVRSNPVAHRVSFEHFREKIPTGLVLDHLCRVRRCVNPHHLEVVTTKVNSLRGISPAVLIHLSDRCKNGHLYDEENLRVTPTGNKKCRACQRRWSAENKIRAKIRVQGERPNG